MGILIFGGGVWTATVTGPVELGNERTCCIQGREFNKIAE
jgi:hypothetical protein